MALSGPPPDGCTTSWFAPDFVALCWISQIYTHVPDPKPSYVADWDDLPTWQQETDSDIFERIEQED